MALLYRLHRFAEQPLRRIEQAERDRVAQEIAAEPERRFISNVISGNNISPFALYLRPFALETIFREYREELILPHTALIQLTLRRKINFDLILVEYFHQVDLTLISIGAPNEKEGAGHVSTTDALWQDCFHKLAKRATTIVVVPEFNPASWRRLDGCDGRVFLQRFSSSNPKSIRKRVGRGCGNHISRKRD